MFRQLPLAPYAFAINNNYVCAIIFMSVDLPDPLGPKRPTNLPWGIKRLTFSITGLWGVYP